MTILLHVSFVRKTANRPNRCFSQFRFEIKNVVRINQSSTLCPAAQQNHRLHQNNNLREKQTNEQKKNETKQLYKWGHLNFIRRDIIRHDNWIILFHFIRRKTNGKYKIISKEVKTPKQKFQPKMIMAIGKYVPSFKSCRISFVRWKLISSRSCCNADCGRSNAELANAMIIYI